MDFTAWAAFVQTTLGLKLRTLVFVVFLWSCSAAVSTFLLSAPEADPQDAWLWLAVAAVSCSGWIALLIRGENFIRNGRFNGRVYWGSGYIEDRTRNGNNPVEVDLLPYNISPSPAHTQSHGHVDAQTRSWPNSGSFQFEHGHPMQAGHWASVVQRIYNLKPHSRYTLRFKVRGTAENPKAFFVTTAFKWAESLRYVSLPGDKWQRVTVPFHSGELDYTEIRFVIQAQGRVWITGVSVRAPIWRRIP